MADATFEPVIIGAGHNGMALGTYLARSGWDVAIFDMRSEEGGGLCTEELTRPGFLHNVHTYSNKNPPLNKAQPSSVKKIGASFLQPEIIRVACDVHPWMFSWISVFDHPYFSVSGKDGSFKIVNVKPGKYTLQAAHRKAGTVTRELEIKEGATAKVELTLEAK